MYTKRKTLFALILIATISVCFIKKSNRIQPLASNYFEPITVLELFTSQGCSSCPPADKLLSETIKDGEKSGKKIFALSFHVDYWNRLGWADPFSSSAYTARQQNYVRAFGLDGAYTPQLVVNGIAQFTGSDREKLKSNLATSQQEKALVGFTTLDATIENDKTITVNYALDGNIVGNVINVALVSNKETTAVKNGENEGRNLVNEHVVKYFYTAKANSKGTLKVPFVDERGKSNFSIIAYIQQTQNNKIIGAASVGFK